MTGLTPSMRLKVKADTFYLPDEHGAVYFRNNQGSFRMEGTSIDQWIEKLIPVFNGAHSLQDLTDGLPGPYRDRVYEIADVLYRHGFARDVSQERPHQLPDEVVDRYACNIEFLDHLADSGAYRFQSYRESSVLAVGSGPFLVALVAALFESGLPRLHVLMTDAVPTNRERLAELLAHVRKTDAEAALDEVTFGSDGVSRWQEAVQPFDFIVYVSEAGDFEELHTLHAVCREQGKVLLPALHVEQVGMVGPLVKPDSDACFESAWRRIHQSALCKDEKLHAFSSTAGAMMANLVAFELFKALTGVPESNLQSHFYLLNLETLEGNWHAFLPHPQVSGGSGWMTAEWIDDLQLCSTGNSEAHEPTALFLYFSQLTSPESGILHTWGEGDLTQLPLAQCRVQAVDVLSDGPAALLPELVCTGVTHEEARRAAALSGIEAYVSRMASQLIATLPARPEVADMAVDSEAFVGIGAGETVAEGVCRALQKCLVEELAKLQASTTPVSVSRVQLRAVEDEDCQFYLQALTTLHLPPEVGVGPEVCGFPTVWVRTRGGWHGSVGLNTTFALRRALQHALMAESDAATQCTAPGVEVVSVTAAAQAPHKVAIPGGEDSAQVLQSALQVLQRNGKRLVVFHLAAEPFLKEQLAGVFGVVLREEGDS